MGQMSARQTAITCKLRYGIDYYSTIGSRGGKVTNGGRFKEPGFAREMAYKSWENHRGK